MLLLVSSCNASRVLYEIYNLIAENSKKKSKKYIYNRYVFQSCFSKYENFFSPTIIFCVLHFG